jgi:hypothetical protein
MQDDVLISVDVVAEYLDADLMPDVLRHLIAETLVRLPEDIRAFARSNIKWRVFEPTWRGATYPLPEAPPPLVTTQEEWRTLIEQRQQAPALEQRWLVVLSNDLAKDDVDPEAVRSTVAHEIAHAVLGHGAFLESLGFEDMERAADRLATAWGFACWPSWVDVPDPEVGP